MNLICILDDGETFGGLGHVVECEEGDLSEAARDALGEGEVTPAFEEVESGKAKGRIFDIAALIRFYDEFERDSDNIGAGPEVWEAYREVVKGN